MKYLPLFLASIPSCVLAALLPQEQEWHQQFALDGWNTMFPSITNIINDTDLKTAYSRGNYQLVIVNHTVEDVSEIVIHCNEIETKVEKINSRSILVVNCGFQKTGDTITWRMSCSINGKTMSTI